MLRFSRLAPLALVLALLACQDSSPTAPTQSTTRIGTGKGFTLLLTDAPGDFQSAVVTISQITLQGSGGGVPLLQQPFTGDLLDLQNEVATLVQGMDIPAGSYSQLRLVLSGAYIAVETTEGTRVYASSPDYPGLPAGTHVDGTLRMPSMGTSGLKIQLPGGQLDIGDGEKIVMIDFDAANSFGHQAGKSGQWVMHPVVKATDVTFGGNLLAQLQLGSDVTLPQVDSQDVTLGDFTAVLTPVGGGASQQLTLTPDSTGVYGALFKGLVPGDYSLSFTGPAGLLVTFSPEIPVTVTVNQRETTTEMVTLASAALPATVTATLKLDSAVTLPSIGSPPAPVTLSQFQAELTPEGGTATQVVFADSDGIFSARFPGLPAGTYSLNVVTPAGITATYSPAPPVSISLAAGASDTTRFVITAAAPK